MLPPATDANIAEEAATNPTDSDISEGAATAPTQLDNEPQIAEARGQPYSRRSGVPRDMFRARGRTSNSDFGIYQRLEVLAVNPRYTVRVCTIGFARAQVEISIEGRLIVASYHNNQQSFRKVMHVPEMYDISTVYYSWVSQNSIHVFVSKINNAVDGTW